MSDSGENNDITLKGPPFKCRFRIKVQEEPVKNGELLIFTIFTEKLENAKEYEVKREFDDVQWLHHNIVTQSNTEGVIVPPLPPRSVVEVKAAEKASKQQLGTTAVMKGDSFERDVRKLEKYLRSMAEHPVFGDSSYLDGFLTVEKAPIRAKVKRGILGKVSSAVSEVRKGNHKDIDEYFIQQKQWFQDYHEHLKSATSTFNRIVTAESRLSATYSNLSTTMATSAVAAQDGANANANMLLINFGEALDDASQNALVSCTNNDRTLGFTLDLYLRFMDPCKDMLFRRLCILIDFEDANRAFIKAKPEKKQMMERAKNELEKKFKDCCEKAKEQLKQFHQTRVLDYQAALCRFTEAHIKTARDSYALTLKTLNVIRAIDVSADE